MNKYITIALILSIGIALATSSGDCLGFNKQQAGYIAKYAFCSDLLNNYTNQLVDWTYEPCLSAQTADKIADINFVLDQELNLLALFVYDKQRDLIVLSFRGSVCGSKNANAYTDIDFDSTPYIDPQSQDCKEQKDDCRIHQGFFKAYNKLKAKIRENTTFYVKKYPKSKFLITGISLGGALAAIASYDIKIFLKAEQISFNNFIYYTFGQPRIGNKKLADSINKELGKNIYRVINNQDPVPHMPPRPTQILIKLIKLDPFINTTALNISNPIDYYHPGVQVFVENMENGKDFHVCNGDNGHCSLNPEITHFKYDACDHLKYAKIPFSSLGQCKGPQTEKHDDQISLLKRLQQVNKILNWIKYQICPMLCNRKQLDCSSKNIPELTCPPSQPSKPPKPPKPPKLCKCKKTQIHSTPEEL